MGSLYSSENFGSICSGFGVKGVGILQERDMDSLDRLIVA